MVFVLLRWMHTQAGNIDLRMQESCNNKCHSTCSTLSKNSMTSLAECLQQSKHAVKLLHPGGTVDATIQQVA